jgi:adenylosuccinate synthase
MKTARIVIGSNLGDEGKGLMTDYFAGDAEVVFRFNGGAQAGHTVTTPEGQRHVFSHFGSGSLRDVPTFLGWDFVVNPMNYRAERRVLTKLALSPKVYVDPRALVTTPYDVLLNQFAEVARGSSRHGSVGIGFGETIERGGTEYATRVHDLAHLNSTPLIRFREVWVTERARALGFTLTDEQRETLMDDNIIHRFLEDVDHFLTTTDLAIESDFLDSRDTVIFEGAQGLMLDQDYGSFPHVTRSNTGLQNVIKILNRLKVAPESLEAVYVTRPYLTRHGAGPMTHELPGKPYDGIVDLTNITNAWQGSLRFAPLDIDLTAKFINRDILRRPWLGPLADKGGFRLTHTIALTCCDQVPERFEIVRDGCLLKVGAEGLFNQLRLATGALTGYRSFGPTRNHVFRVLG